MTTVVQVLEQAEFDAWVDQEAAVQAAGQSDLGKRSFDSVCAKCHGFQGEGDIGPVIQGKVQDRDGLLTFLDEGQDTPGFEGSMPAVGIGWPDRQVDALLQYLTTDPKLSGGVTSGG
jgi:mono/diheme cytochrome c family protein